MILSITTTRFQACEGVAMRAHREIESPPKSSETEFIASLRGIRLGARPSALPSGFPNIWHGLP